PISSASRPQPWRGAPPIRAGESRSRGLRCPLPPSEVPLQRSVMVSPIGCRTDGARAGPSRRGPQMPTAGAPPNERRSPSVVGADVPALGDVMIGIGDTEELDGKP